MFEHAKTKNFSTLKTVGNRAPNVGGSMPQSGNTERGVVLLLNLRIQNGIKWLVVLTNLGCQTQTVLTQSRPESMSSQNSPS